MCYLLKSMSLFLFLIKRWLRVNYYPWFFMLFNQWIFINYPNWIYIVIILAFSFILFIIFFYILLIIRLIFFRIKPKSWYRNYIRIGIFRYYFKIKSVLYFRIPIIRNFNINSSIINLICLNINWNNNRRQKAFPSTSVMSKINVN